LVVGLFIQANINDPVEAFIQIIIEFLVTLVFIWGMLLKDGGLYNFERFLTAILVCENFIYTLALPLAFWYIFAKGTDMMIYPIYIGVALILWSIVIIANLLSGMFNFDWKIGGIWSVGYFFITYLGSFMLLLMI